ncbi:AAA family ATPase [Chitinophagaceae bacterium MMS25-I14]
MSNLQEQTTYTENLFNGYFIESKSVYLHYFNRLPNIYHIENIDAEKALEAICSKYAAIIRETIKYRNFNHDRGSFSFDETIVVLTNNCVLELDSNYCTILHDGCREEFISELAGIAAEFKQPARKEPLEINIIVKGRNGIELKPMEIKRTELDLDLFYEDDFVETDKIIQARLSRENDKGIVLLHGLPGTGKTTYLRYLIGSIKKRVLFLSPNVAGDLMSPYFIDLLIDNPNSVLIIEDAENIIVDRRMGGGSGVSNLLNISDGLLADFLNVQLICTFNNSLTMVDSALMRKGRLIAKYEFVKLSAGKAQKLSSHLGHNAEIHQPMTVAEIVNQHEPKTQVQHVETIGFRRNPAIENTL